MRILAKSWTAKSFFYGRAGGVGARRRGVCCSGVSMSAEEVEWVGKIMDSKIIFRGIHCSGVSMSAEISATLQIPPTQKRECFLSSTSFSNFWLHTRTPLDAKANHAAQFIQQRRREAENWAGSRLWSHKSFFKLCNQMPRQA